MAKVKLTQVKSTNGSTLRQKRTLQVLKLNKIHHSVEVEETPETIGMINKVKHLVTIEKLS
jgi:large subunit ribosomal protein L30